jgi:hypothetical protein
VLGNPVVQFMPGQRACDIPRELIDDSGPVHPLISADSL